MIFFDDLEQDAIERDIPVMQKEGLLFMIKTLNEMKAESLLEIGSAIGYSAMMMASNVEGLHIETLERDEDRYLEAVHHIDENHLEEQIKIYHEDALLFDDSSLVYPPYDCIFIDAAKAQYQKFFEKYVPYLKEDGLVIVDNLDFHGMIFDIPHIKNRNTRALVRKIKRFKDWIFANEDFEAKYYEVGDGLCLITRKEKHEDSIALK